MTSNNNTLAKTLALAGGLMMAGILPALAQEATPPAAPVMDKGDVAWMMTSSLLVLFMALPGLALFYGGLVRSKNVLSILMQTTMIAAIMMVVWVFYGYSFAFGGSDNPFFGGFGKLFLKGVTVDSMSATFSAGYVIPEYLFITFQMTFAAITPALIIGAFAERVKFSAVVLFSILWATFVYVPVAHMVWDANGYLFKMGAIDFAGGTVVHINAGVAGLVLALVLGKRIGYGKEAMFPSSIALTALGAALLWFGWFGFNAGSALVADGLAGSAFLVTNTSAAAAALAWMFAEWLVNKKPTVLGIASGVVAGLVAITPAAGFVGVGASILIGLAAGVLGFFSVAKLKHKLGYDDSLDAFGVHGMCGTLGALATGLFADPAINSAGTGLFFGNPGQLWIQVVSIVATAAFTAVGTLVVVMVTKALTRGVRVDEENEMVGLDSAVHGERAFEIQ
jgi:Amt family ammonium transporter